MKKLYILVLLLTFTLAANAQNLVQNPGFETLISCPPDISSIGSATSWSQTTDGTSDLFSSCNNGASIPSGLNIGMPSNFAGSQTAYNGQTYGGMILFDDAGTTYREYCQTQLSSPLIVGQTYCAKFQVSLGGMSGYAANGLGALFTTTDMSQDPTYGQFTGFFETLPFTPQFMSNTVITDTTNWVEIGGTFVATQPYQYVTIGCFLADGVQQHPTHLSNNPGTLAQEFAYYYLDEIVVEQATANSPLTITPSSQGICLGQSVTLTATGQGANTVTWNTTPPQTGNSITVTPPLGTTTYNATAGAACTSYNGTVDVNVIDCVNGQLALSVTEDTICQGESTTLTVVGGTNYLWSNGASGVSSITVSPATTTNYSVIGNVGGNNQTLGATIVVIPIQAIASYEVLEENTVSFSNTSGGTIGNPYWWFGDGDTSSLQNPVHIYQQEGIYQAYLVVENLLGCLDTTFFTVNIGGQSFFYIPNSFTPNGDGINETFFPKGSGCRYVVLEVFNRWGQRLFYSGDDTNPWDGKYNGDICMPDIYIYNIHVGFNNGTEKKYYGKLALIR